MLGCSRPTPGSEKRKISVTTEHRSERLNAVHHPPLVLRLAHPELIFRAYIGFPQDSASLSLVTQISFNRPAARPQTRAIRNPSQAEQKCPPSQPPRRTPPLLPEARRKPILALTKPASPVAVEKFDATLARWTTLTTRLASDAVAKARNATSLPRGGSANPRMEPMGPMMVKYQITRFEMGERG